MALHRRQTPLLGNGSIRSTRTTVQGGRGRLGSSIRRIHGRKRRIRSHVSNVRKRVERLGDSVSRLVLQGRRVTSPRRLPRAVTHQRTAGRRARQHLSAIRTHLLRRRRGQGGLGRLRRRLARGRRVTGQ